MWTLRMGFVVGLSLCSAAEAQRLGNSAPPPPRSQALIVDSSGPAVSTGRDVADLDDRITTAGRNGEFSRRTARRAGRAIDYIAELDQRYAAGGTSAAEQRELDARAAILRDQIEIERVRGRSR